jgi:hypothetical protein
LKNIKILALFVLLTGSICANAQDNLHEHIENGKFYGIFPVTENFVGYTDSLALIGPLNKDSLYDKARAFFDQKEDAKYYFESEDREAGELIYQGKLSKNIFSQNLDIHFTVILNFIDSICIIKLFEIVMATPKAQYDPNPGYGPGNMVGGIKLNKVQNATQLENISIGKGEFSRKYCEEINKRFINIINGLSSQINNKRMTGSEQESAN